MHVWSWRVVAIFFDQFWFRKRDSSRGNNVHLIYVLQVVIYVMLFGTTLLPSPMSTKLKARRAAVLLKTDNSDEELTILSPKFSVTDSDYELDWSYTARCTKEWSGDELLSHLCSKVFTIPPRDYNPSAPFVHVRTEDGVTTILPHGYRIPLMFIAKYQWETTIRTLSLQNRHSWEAVRDELFHLSRLCHTLFSKARAKAESGGMEKGWRCVMFDRVLTRLYKGWPVSSPAKLEAFISHFGSKEYEGDVLKYGMSAFYPPAFNVEHNARLEKMGVKRFISTIITDYLPYGRKYQRRHHSC